MKHSYIATGKEAELLHSGQQTAIIVPMKVQPEYKPEGGYEWYVRDKQQRWVQYTTQTLIDRLSPYTLHQPVYVRERYYSGYVMDINDNIPDDAELEHWYFAETRDARPGGISDEYCYHLWGDNKECWPRWQSPTTMPKSAARTWFVPVEVQAVRVRDLTVEQVCNAGKEYIPLYCSITVQNYIVDRFGQQAWDDNVFVWVYKIEKYVSNL